MKMDARSQQQNNYLPIFFTFDDDPSFCDSYNQYIIMGGITIVFEILVDELSRLYWNYWKLLA